MRENDTFLNGVINCLFKNFRVNSTKNSLKFETKDSSLYNSWVYPVQVTMQVSEEVL